MMTTHVRKVGVAGANRQRKKPSTTLTVDHVSKIDKDEAVNFFNELCDETEPNRITTEGIKRLCRLLDIQDPNSLRGQVMMWKLHALSEPGTISLKEFLAGMESLNISSCEALKEKAINWRGPNPTAPDFKQFAEMVFVNCCDKIGKLGAQCTAHLLTIVFRYRDTPHMYELFDFLREDWRQRVSFAEWMEIVKFLLTRDDQLSSFRLHTWTPLIESYVAWGVANNYLCPPAPSKKHTKPPAKSTRSAKSTKVSKPPAKLTRSAKSTKVSKPPAKLTRSTKLTKPPTK